MQTVCCIILGGQIGDRGRLQFTGSASALVSASEQAPTRAPPLRSTLVEESGEGRGGLATRGGESGEGGSMRVPVPRGVERSRDSRRAHVGRAYPASREGGPECCVYASPRVRAGTPTALSPVWGGDIVIHRQNRGHRQIANARWIFKWQRRAALRQEIRQH